MGETTHPMARGGGAGGGPRGAEERLRVAEAQVRRLEETVAHKDDVLQHWSAAPTLAPVAEVAHAFDRCNVEGIWGTISEPRCPKDKINGVDGYSKGGSCPLPRAPHFRPRTVGATGNALQFLRGGLPGYQ